MLLPRAGTRADCGVLTALIGRPILVAALLVSTGARHVYGNNRPTAPIVTDRPAVTDSSIVVPAGSLQAENGFAETVNQGSPPYTWTVLGVGLNGLPMGMTLTQGGVMSGLPTSTGAFIHSPREQESQKRRALTNRERFWIDCIAGLKFAAN
jgi:hypothetical protein